MVRTGGDHNAVYDTAVSIHSDGGSAIRRQHQSGVRSVSGSVGADPGPRPGQRARPGSLRCESKAEERLCATMESIRPANLQGFVERGGRLPGLETDKPRRARRELKPVDARTTRARCTIENGCS